jgi:cobalt-zinc-cadmium efflux system outer membrane protein
VSLRCLLVLALAGACGAAPLSGSAAEPLRLEDAIERALASHPSLAAETAQLQAVQARAARESLASPYFVGGEVENIAGTGALSGVDSAETTLRIGRVLELGGKRAARQALGAAEVEQQRNQADATRIAVASRTAGRFIEVVADQRRLAYAHERVKQAARTRREVASWVAAARNPESDLRAAEIAVAEAELEREHAEHELDSARVSLAASWGSFDADFSEAVGQFDTLPAIESFQSLSDRLPLTPEQRASLLEARTIGARRRVAEAAAKPDITVNLGVRRLEALDDQGLVMSVQVPLGNRRRSAFSVAEADAELAALDARRDAQRYERHQELFERYQELGHARLEAETLRKTMIPKAEQAVAFNRRGFEAGNFSYLALAQAQRTLFELRQRSTEAIARYHTLLVEVERLTAAAQDATP